MIVVSTVGTQDNLLIYIYNYDSAQFSLQSTNTIAVSGRILNVLANDFNQDNRVDFLVTYYNPDTNTYSTVLFVQSSDTDFIFSINNSLNLPTNNKESPILIADINGDTMYEYP